MIKILMTILFFASSAFASNMTIKAKSTIGRDITLNITDKGLSVKEWKRGGVVLVFFGVNCPACIEEIPTLKEIQRGRNNLLVVGVQVQEGIGDEEAREFTLTHKINYPVINYSYAMDLILFLRSELGWGGEIPVSYLFDKSGKFIKRYTGVVRKSVILKDYKMAY
jgi:thiol-disulfide isomerase/thioredoxin